MFSVSLLFWLKLPQLRIILICDLQINRYYTGEICNGSPGITDNHGNLSSFSYSYVPLRQAVSSYSACSWSCIGKISFRLRFRKNTLSLTDTKNRNFTSWSEESEDASDGRISGRGLRCWLSAPHGLQGFMSANNLNHWKLSNMDSWLSVLS